MCAQRFLSLVTCLLSLVTCHCHLSLVSCHLFLQFSVNMKLLGISIYLTITKCRGSFAPKKVKWLSAKLAFTISLNSAVKCIDCGRSQNYVLYELKEIVCAFWVWWLEMGPEEPAELLMP